MKKPALAILAAAVLAAGTPIYAWAEPWLNESFDSYASGALSGQGNWQGGSKRIVVVTTDSLSGRAAYCDADESHLMPVVNEAWLPTNAPDTGHHVFSFAFRVESSVSSSTGMQASLQLGNDQSAAIYLFIQPTSVVMSISNDVLGMPPPTKSWDLGNVPGGPDDLTTGTYHVFELDLDFGQAGTTMDDYVREVRLDGQTVPDFAGPIWLAAPIDRLTLINGETVEAGAPDGVFFDNIFGRPRDPAIWLNETFDDFDVGPLLGQGDWTGVFSRVAVVSTNSLTGNAAYCDADDPPIMAPYATHVLRPVKVPDSGTHVLSFAVRVEAPTSLTAPQAALELGNLAERAIQLEVMPKTVHLFLSNAYFDCIGGVTWDLGTVPGGYPDFTTGTYHRIEIELDFGRAGDTMDDTVRRVRMDGKAYEFGCGSIALLSPADTLFIVNGMAVDGDKPDAVFFDNILGRRRKPAHWLDETFEDYAVGPLLGQGEWTGVFSRVAVVSTNSLTGNAAYCDADDPPLEAPFATHVLMPVDVPDSGAHLFSFAVRVETPTTMSAPQAALELGSTATRAIQLEVLPQTVNLRINNDFLDCIGGVTWDLGSVPGGNADFTTGTYHTFEIELDFGRAGDTMDDVVRAVRMDGVSYEFGCGSIALLSPADTLYIVNGTSTDGAKPDAVFFDNILGFATSTPAKHWDLYF